MRVHGIHHLTAVSADISGNYRFYTQDLGMRLVKRSVNQDDVSAYHLFYADAVGSPGTDLTFFDWAVPAERRGTHSIVGTGLRVTGQESIDYWSRRLEQLGRNPTYGEFAGRSVIRFEDPEGQRLQIVDDGGGGDESVPWDGSPVPAEHQIRGLGPITLSVPDIAPTDAVLRGVLGLDRLGPLDTGDEDVVQIYGLDESRGPHGEIHVRQEPGLSPARPGAGGVHHVAFRVADEQYEEWAERLTSLRIPNSGPVDRYYFRSLYFREPNGILFELATDGPGFAVDENLATLGEKVVLPPFLESRRAAILANLKPIESPGTLPVEEE